MKKRLLLWALAVLVLAAAVGVWLGATHVPGPGGLYRKDSAALDLRDESMSLEQYEKLRASLPNCYIRWSVPVGNKTFDSESTTVYVEQFTEADFPAFAHFPNLLCVNGSRSNSYEALLALYASGPDFKVKWGVTIGGKNYAQGCSSLRLAAENLTPGELAEALPLLPELTAVTVTGAMDPAEQAGLIEQFPALVFDWPVVLCGREFRSTATELSFAGDALTEADLQEIEENLFRFYNPELLDLTGCTAGDEALAAFRERTGLDVIWTTTLFGKTVSTGAVKLDLSGRSVDVARLEAVLPWFFRLETVDMCDCGISDEEMDALNSRHENIRFVWAIYMGAYRVRTDATGFICTSVKGASLTDSQAWKLRYCTDLLALDLGHRGVLDLSFVQYMPNLKYLIVSCTPLSDLSPLAGHPSLLQIEAVSTRITDLTPLLEIPTLLDLNLSFSPAGYGAEWTAVLTQMPQLERLWFHNRQFSDAQKAQLAEALPNTQMYNAMDEGHCMGGTWRYHERYYEMRDILGMFYMAELGLPIGNIKRLPESE